MKTNMTGLDLRCVLHEIKSEVEGAWITNIYQLGKKLFIFKIRQPGQPTGFLVIELGKRLHLTNYSRLMPKSPPPLCSMFRKHLRDKRITKINQLKLDRIIEIYVSSEKGEYKVVIELFGQGNIILVSPENKIIGASTYRKMTVRDIHPGREFIYPPMPENDILGYSRDTFLEKLKENPNLKLGVFLNKELNIGPIWSKSLLAETGLKNKPIKNYSQEDLQPLLDAIDVMHSRLLNHEYSPRVYLESPLDDNSSELQEVNEEYLVNETKTNDNVSENDVQDDDDITFEEEEKVFTFPFEASDILEISPLPLMQYADLPIYEHESLNDLLDYFFSENEDSIEIEEEFEVIDSRTSRLERRLQDQQQHIENLRKESHIKREIADWLYLNMYEVDELLRLIREARQQNMSWEDIMQRLEIGKQKGLGATKYLERISPKEGLVYLRADLNGQEKTISLNFRETVTKIANDLYMKAKKNERKIHGALKALEETKHKIEETKKSQQDLQQLQVRSKPLRRRKKRWYEKFKWFFTSNDHLVIAGYDAETNERLVKRYMDENDMFLHADIHGSPSVIVKHMGFKITQEDLEEAAQFAVAHSNAWKGKLGVADAYAVTPEQVSLSAPSGEFLPKGSIMIYGEKQYFRNLPVELMFGVLVREYWIELIQGPPKAIQKRTKYTVTIKPGDTQPGTIGSHVYRILQAQLPENERYKMKSITVDEIIRFIPGNSDIIKKENNT